MKRLKQKESNLLVSAKLHAPVKYTAPERIKLTLQNYRLENKSLKSEIQQMKLEIENKLLDIKDNSLHNDVVSIMSNADYVKWDKHTCDLIGYVDLGNTGLNYAALKKTDEFASCFSFSSAKYCKSDEIHYCQFCNQECHCDSTLPIILESSWDSRREM